MEAIPLKIKKQKNINILGLLLTSLGCILFGFAFALEAVKSHAPAFSVFNDLFLTGDMILTISVVFIFVGVVLFSIDIFPSRQNLTAIEALKIRYILGEITQQQYEGMKNDSDVPPKTVF